MVRLADALPRLGRNPGLCYTLLEAGKQNGNRG
jgi:hypothetical protein